MRTSTSPLKLGNALRSLRTIFVRLVLGQVHTPPSMTPLSRSTLNGTRIRWATGEFLLSLKYLMSARNGRRRKSRLSPRVGFFTKASAFQKLFVAPDQGHK